MGNGRERKVKITFPDGSSYTEILLAPSSTQAYYALSRKMKGKFPSHWTLAQIAGHCSAPLTKPYHIGGRPKLKGLF